MAPRIRSLLACLALLIAAPSAAHTLDGPPTAAIADELRGINQQLQYARDRLNQALSVEGDAPLQVLNRAQVAYFEGDHPTAAAKLFDLVARPGFRDHPAHPEALAWLGESLWALGLEAAAVDALRESLESPRQSPSAWRRNFVRYLARARDREPLDRLRVYWQRYMGLPAADDDLDLGELTYNYGRALFRGGALDEAEAAFRAVPADAADALRAAYFVGVVALKRGEILAAQAAFEGARAAWQTRADEVLQPLPTPLAAIPTDGPRRAYARVTAEGELVAPDRQDEAAAAAATALDPEDETRHVRRMGAVIHLALARLAAARGDDAEAWKWYRRVPPGDPDHAQALSEATFVLFRMGEYDWCVRLVDQLLAARGDDLSAAQLGLWRAQLQARAARYEDARQSYAELERAMQRRREELEQELDADRRLFPAAALAWTAPEDARRARRLEAELVLQEEALNEARELAASLAELSRTADVLPVVKNGRALHGRLVQRLQHVQTHMSGPEVRAADPSAASGAADAVDPGTLQRSAARLSGRLDGFQRHLETYAATYRARLQQVIDAEQPGLERLTAALATEQAAAKALADELRLAARSNIDRYAAESMFGEVDLAWWRKEEISGRIKAEADRRDAARKAMEAQPEADETPADAPAGAATPATPPGQPAEADGLLPIRSAPADGAGAAP